MPRETIKRQKSAGRPARRRGGRRPGAGAPKGNLNAAKHGRYSKQLQAVHQALKELAANPALRLFFAELTRQLIDGAVKRLMELYFQPDDWLQHS